MAKSLRVGVLAAVVAFTAAAARADDGDYQIKMDRPEKVGEKFNINSTVDVTNSIKVDVDGHEVKNEAHDAEFTLDAQLTVTAVDAKGRETGFHLKVKKLEGALEHAIAAPLVEADSEIDGEFKDGKATFSLKMGGLSQDAVNALSAIFQPPHSENTDDQMFGSLEKKKPGDVWKVNSKAMASDAKALKLEPDNITGEVTLIGKAQIADIPALELHTNVEISEMTIENLGKSRDGNITIKIETKLPVDPADPSNSVTMDEKIHGVFTPTDKNGKMAVFTIDNELARTETRLLQK